MANYKLRVVGTNAKTIKGDGSEYLTAILYMTPYKVMVDGKHFNSCSMAEQASCIEGCLYTAGRGKFSNVQTARQRKAEWFYRDRVGFMKQLYHDIQKFSNYCKKRNIQPCVRLNGTTDIQWELIPAMPHSLMNIFEQFPEVQFYDYTKIANRKCKDIPNYHLTWSYSNANPEYAKLLDKALEQGMNAAVVYRNRRMRADFGETQLLRDLGRVLARWHETGIDPRRTGGVGDERRQDPAAVERRDGRVRADSARPH
mgnify:CR=1 FL=1